MKLWNNFIPVNFAFHFTLSLARICLRCFACCLLLVVHTERVSKNNSGTARQKEEHKHSRSKPAIIKYSTPCIMGPFCKKRRKRGFPSPVFGPRRDRRTFFKKKRDFRDRRKGLRGKSLTGTVLIYKK